MTDLDNPYSPPACPTELPSSRFETDRSWHVTSRGWFSIALLLVSAIVAFVNVLLYRMEIDIYFNVWDGAEYDEAQHAAIAEISTGVNRVALLTTPILMIAWIHSMYRAHQNLALRQVGRLTHYAHSAIWTWFVPIFNYWAPYQVMAEIYRKSQPESLELRWNPLGGAILGTWWACWIFSSLTATASSMFMVRTERDDVYVWSLAGLAVAQISRFAAAFLAMAVIVLVDFNQARRRYELSTESPKSSVPVPSSTP
jgi:hypothetical protein